MLKCSHQQEFTLGVRFCDRFVATAVVAAVLVATRAVGVANGPPDGLVSNLGRQASSFGHLGHGFGSVFGYDSP